MLNPEVIEEIWVLVHSGFYDKERLMEIICTEMYAPGELNPDDVSAAIDAERAKWESEKQTWPEVTDCDRLNSAFAAMNERGIIALQNAGLTQNDGYDDFRDAYENHRDQSSILGYCFYHGQDLERAVRGGGLFVAFGPVEAKDEEARGPEIGNIVREELERVGLIVVWDGTLSKRIHVPSLVWQRR